MTLDKEAQIHKAARIYCEDRRVLHSDLWVQSNLSDFGITRKEFWDEVRRLKGDWYWRGLGP